MPDFKKIPIGSRGAINVFIVDGEYIRTNLYIDFVSGGHDLVYGKDGEIVNDKGVKPFIPDNEIWLDFDLAESEVGFVLLHELYERDKMSKGMNDIPYSLRNHIFSTCISECIWNQVNLSGHTFFDKDNEEFQITL